MKTLKVNLVKQEKEAMVKRLYASNSEFQTYCIAHDFSKEKAADYVAKQKAIEINHDDLKANVTYVESVSTKEQVEIIQKYLTPSFFYKEYTLDELIEQNARNILPILEVASEELILKALNSKDNYLYILLPEEYRTHEVIKKQILFAETTMRNHADAFTDEELKEIISQNPRTYCYVPKERVTKDLVYTFLENSIKKNVAVDYQDERVTPDELKDRVFWQGMCMASPYYLSKCPKEYINAKLRDYCMDKIMNHMSKSGYTAPLFLLESLPDDLLTHDICLQACILHFAGVEKIPDKFKNDEFYLELIENGQCNFISNVDLNTISPKILAYALSKTVKGRFSHFCQEKIPKAIWTKEVVEALSKVDRNLLDNIPKSFITREICLQHMKVNGCSIDKVPSKYLDDEMIDAAMEENGYGVVQHLTEAQKTKEFYHRNIAKGTLDMKYIPKEYITKNIVMDYITRNLYFPFDDIPSELRTEEIVRSYIKQRNVHNRTPHIYKGSQTPEITEWIVDELGDLDLIYNSLYMLAYPSGGLIDKLIDKFGVEVAKKTSNFTREQIERMLAINQDSIIDMPKWYREEYRSQSVKTVTTVIIPKEPVELTVEVNSSANIETFDKQDDMLETFTQLSLFEMFSA